MNDDARGDLEPRIEHLEQEVARLRQLQRDAIASREDAPDVPLWRARKAAEAVCRHFAEVKQVPLEKRTTLDEFINKLREHLPRHVVHHLQTVQRYGNYGSHDQREEPEHMETMVAPCLSALSAIVSWYIRDVLHQPDDDATVADGLGKASETSPPRGALEAPVTFHVSVSAAGLLDSPALELAIQIVDALDKNRPIAFTIEYAAFAELRRYVADSSADAKVRARAASEIEGHDLRVTWLRAALDSLAVVFQRSTGGPDSFSTVYFAYRRECLAAALDGLVDLICRRDSTTWEADGRGLDIFQLEAPFVAKVVLTAAEALEMSKLRDDGAYDLMKRGGNCDLMDALPSRLIWRKVIPALAVAHAEHAAELAAPEALAQFLAFYRWRVGAS